MKDYYKILGVNKNASQNKVFRQFRDKILKLNSNSIEVQDLIASYLILHEKRRKFYILLLEQTKSKKSLNEKYLKILKNTETLAESLSEKYEKEQELFLNPLTKKPIIELLVSAIGPLTGTDLSTPISLGVGLLIVGTILTVIGFYRIDSIYIVISVVLFIFGILLCRKGITEWRRENFEKITTHNIV
jgi:hypothetical protein